MKNRLRRQDDENESKNWNDATMTKRWDRRLEEKMECRIKRKSECSQGQVELYLLPSSSYASGWMVQVKKIVKAHAE
jgi:hypothetical protein